MRPPRNVQVLKGQDLDKMKAACRLAANVLDETCRRVAPGVNTGQIDQWVHEMTLDAGAYPSTLNYPKSPTDPRLPRIAPGAFPKSCCTSINHVVCHGIPKETDVLKNGDIVNIDVTVTLDGFFGDTSRTVYVGTPSIDAQKVVEAARKSLELGIQAVQPNGRLIAVGQAIYEYASNLGMGVVREYTGHGIGRVFHAEPQVCHYPSHDSDCILVPGMTFTIEPMINLGTWRTKLDNEDGWTVYTLDGKLSAQFEHTITVTDQGAEILTIPG